MKRLLVLKAAVLAMATLVCVSNASAVLVAGWDNFSSGLTPTTPHEAPGITATMVNVGFSNGSSEDRGSSSDTTWGSFDGNGTAASSTIVGNVNLTAHNGETGDTMQITIVNNGTDDLDLGAFHMDALAFRPNASRTFTLDVATGGALTAGNVYTSAAQEITSLGAAPNAAQDQHDEYDISLNSLADSTLEVGGTVVFDLEFTGGTPGSSGHHLWLDNIAVSGSIVAIPEPSLFAVWTLVGVGTVASRKKRTV